MRIFVLNTGRCGSMAFAKACGHMTNYTSAHESRAGIAGLDRLDYPDDHIEVDNRLAFFLGSLHRHYPDAFYVHLTRDSRDVVDSHFARWRPTWNSALLHPRVIASRLRRGLRNPYGRRLNVIEAFANGVIFGSGLWTSEKRRETAQLFVQTVTDNIAEFLRDKWGTLSSRSKGL